jgi:SAM-dependent methyltransferase
MSPAGREVRVGTPYGEFAAVYDRLAHEDRYRAWSGFILDRVGEAKPPQGCWYELACGTGRLLAALRAAGCDVAGCDRSARMLAVARERLGDDVPLALATLPPVPRPASRSPVSVALCVFDSFNYLPGYDAGSAVLAGVHALLPPGGVFVCDTVGEGVFDGCVARGETARDHGEFSTVTWTERLGSGSYRHHVAVTLRRAGADHVFAEAHDQRMFPREWLAGAARLAGFVDIRVFDDYTPAPAHDRTERLTWVMRRG